jgi:hypothetical protein
MPQAKTEKRLMVHIEIAHTFPVPVNDAFAYITDISNWADYWPNFVRFEDRENARWSKPGDKATVVLKLLNRERVMRMMVDEFQKDAFLAYHSRQQGLPDAQHKRYFEAVPEGMALRMVIEYEPRKGFTGLFDRFYIKRGVEWALRKTIENLERHLRTQGGSGPS